jgi:hypothetical protein
MTNANVFAVIFASYTNAANLIVTMKPPSKERTAELRGSSVFLPFPLPITG